MTRNMLHTIIPFQQYVVWMVSDNGQITSDTYCKNRFIDTGSFILTMIFYEAKSFIFIFFTKLQFKTLEVFSSKL